MIFSFSGNSPIFATLKIENQGAVSRLVNRERD